MEYQIQPHQGRELCSVAMAGRAEAGCREQGELWQCAGRLKRCLEDEYMYEEVRGIRRDEKTRKKM